MQLSDPQESRLRYRAAFYRLFSALFAGAVVVSLTSCRNPEAVSAPPPPVDVEVAQVAARDVPTVKEWIGTLDGRVNAETRGQAVSYTHQTQPPKREA